MPTQMGSTCALATSFRMTIGMFVTGSIISPRIFISTSMASLQHSAVPVAGGAARLTLCVPSADGFSDQRIGASARDADVGVLADVQIFAGMGEAQGAVARGAAQPEAEGLIAAFHVDFL